MTPVRPRFSLYWELKRAIETGTVFPHLPLVSPPGKFLGHVGSPGVFRDPPKMPVQSSMGGPELTRPPKTGPGGSSNPDPTPTDPLPQRIPDGQGMCPNHGLKTANGNFFLSVKNFKTHPSKILLIKFRPILNFKNFKKSEIESPDLRQILKTPKLKILKF